MFREAYGNIWDMDGDAICITTNGYIKNNGEAVMGRGVALEAKQRFPDLAWQLGLKIDEFGNHVQLIHLNPFLYSFPVKHNWWERAELDLIERSAHELMSHIQSARFEHVLLPRPGCGNGGRDWETEVKPILEPILDDRVAVVTYG